MSVLSGIVIGSFNIAEKEELEEIQFPPTHWIMMGLHGRAIIIAMIFGLQ